ncbi:MAG: CBS domain-containing protein [Burkholderiales bacterium]|nr:CBS domain-containing protein [Burkholderiales bacterium]MCW5604413.1 CBS domain-containing protein [Burkholderiales bacterium]
MTRDYTAIKPIALGEGSGYAQPTQAVLERARIDSPAVDVMTDLTRVTAVIILPGDAVDEAHRRMIQRGVRLLLVVDQDRRVHGIVTANDVLGEKPVKAAVQRGVPRSEIQVRDIMTPRDRLEVLDLRDVQAATVGRIVATLKAAGRQHTLVVDLDAKGRQRVCGVFSATQIARQLGIAITTEAVARTFADIEASLGR